jgi:glycine/D-amino acid oxidase-like deaminating enzyme
MLLRPYWWEGVELPRAPDEAPPRSADVVVVGSGYTGTAAAWELARRGRSVLVLEREGLGTGASSRNGGIVHAGGKHSVAEYLAIPGGRALWDDTVAAVDGLEALVAELGIDCGWRRCGHVELAHRPSRTAGLAEAARAAAHVGLPVAYLDRADLAGEIGSEAYHGGLLVETSAAVHPARLMAGLAAAALAAGVAVRDRCPATAIERDGTGFVVRTPRGTVRCGDVLVATNGWTDRLVPWLGRRILPVGSYIVATEPLADDLARSVSPRGRVFFDTKNFLNYWRLSPDGRRVLFGGRTSFAPTDVPAAAARLAAAMVRVHPQLADVAIEYAWGGNVALTRDLLPHVGRVPSLGVAYAMGYCGTGVALAVHLGRRAGAWLAGEGEPGPHGRRDWPPVPAPARVPWLLAAAGVWLHLQDRR